MAVKSLADLLAEGVAGRGVLVRCDLNVPLADGVITDPGRIDASVPTLKALADAGAKVVVTAHLGRPKDGPDPKLSLAPVAAALGERIGRHPLAVILALMACGQLLGFVGVLLALPASAVLLVGLRRLRQTYLDSPMYREGPAEPGQDRRP